MEYTTDKKYIIQKIDFYIKQYKNYLSEDSDISNKMLNNTTTFNSLLSYISANLLNDNIYINISDHSMVRYIFDYIVLLHGKYSQNRINYNSLCIVLNTYPKELTANLSASSEGIQLVKYIRNVCESSVLSENTAVSMFVLKAVYGYSETPQQTASDDITVANLPDIYGTFTELLPEHTDTQPK